MHDSFLAELVVLACEVDLVQSFRQKRTHIWFLVFFHVKFIEVPHKKSLATRERGDTNGAEELAAPVIVLWRSRC